MSTKTVDTERGPVEFLEAGAGQPILYFHGTGLTGDAMAAFESSLVKAGFRLIMLNRPGYGKTPLGEHRSAAACADVAAALLDVLGIHAVNVMGSSGGAAFATSFAVKYANRAASLVLLCPQLHRWDHKRWLPVSSRWTLPWLKNRWLRKLLLKLYAVSLSRTSAQQFLKLEAGQRYDLVCEDEVAHELCRRALLGMKQGVRFPGFENDFIIFVTEDILDQQAPITLPTLVIHDVVDPLAPVDHVRWFESHATNCQCVAVQTAGHLVWVGPDADFMHETRTRFLRQHPPATD